MKRAQFFSFRWRDIRRQATWSGGALVLLALAGMTAPTLAYPADSIGHATQQARPRETGQIGDTPGVVQAPPAQGAPDVSLEQVHVTQAVYDEPLVFDKDTVVRAIIGYTGAGATNVRVTVDFDGKTYTETKPVEGQETPVDVFVGAPQNFRTQTVNVRVDAVDSAADADVSNNAQQVVLPMVKPNEKVTAFFLPVDWTEEQRARYNFLTTFPKFVDENREFLKGAYPLGNDQLVLDSTLAPHMLAPNEKRLADNRGEADGQAMHLMYATISLAARRLRPDATIVVGVLPPGWFAAHGKRGALGMALRDVKGTVTGQYAPTDPTTSAHELAHLFWLYEDYDYSVSPSRPFTWIDRSGYFVQAQEPQEISDTKKIPTFLSSGDPEKSFWVDTRAYEYLMARFTINENGQVSEPMILAATMANQIEPDGKNYPSDYSADFQRFEPDQTTYVSVGAAGMKGGETLEARWFNGNQQLATANQVLNPGSAWYAFNIRDKSGLDQGSYHVDIYLDGKLVKTSRFEVKSSE